MIRIAVLTISDACSKGERKDTSGESIVAWVTSRKDNLAARELVADETLDIVRTLTQWCAHDVADLILTTGVTGLSPPDPPPEATHPVIHRQAPGIAASLRRHGTANPKYAG